MSEEEQLGNVTRGYNYVKPNWQDVLIRLFNEAFDALAAYDVDKNRCAVAVTRLHTALSYNRKRDADWEARWKAFHDRNGPTVTFETRNEEVALLVELAMQDGMVWPRPETWDSTATETLAKP